MIPATIGRMVLYTPNNHSDNTMAKGTGKLAAIITNIWSDRLVNLIVFDGNGFPHSRTSVPLLQDGDSVPYGFYCEWMPFQKGQAAKTEQLEEQLAERGRKIEEARS